MEQSVSIYGSTLCGLFHPCYSSRTFMAEVCRADVFIAITGFTVVYRTLYLFICREIIALGNMRAKRPTADNQII